MFVPIVRQIIHIRDRIIYKGYVKIFRTQLDYEIRFADPIPSNDMAIFNPFDKIGNRFLLILKKNGVEISLNYEEFISFLSILMAYPVEISGAVTHATGGGISATVVCTRLSVFQTFGLADFNKVTYEGVCHIPAETCTILNGPKFDCCIKTA